MRRLIILAVLAAACGSDSKGSDKGETKPVEGEQTDAGRPARKPPSRVLGVAEPSAFNFSYGKGEKPFARVKAAVKKKDWAAARDAARETLTADPDHLDASWELARALVALGDHAGAVEPLTRALTTDYLAYRHEVVPGSAVFGPFLASAPGKQFQPILEQIGQEYLERARGGVFVVARRSSFKAPSGAKKQWATPRAELYAYDRDGKRYLRITHTDHQLAGWMASPSGDEIVYVAYSELKPGAAPTDPVLITRSRVGTLRMEDLTPAGEASLKETARSVQVMYLPGDELWVTGFPPDGRWGVGEGKSFTLDRATSKLTKAKMPGAEPGTPTLLVDYEGVLVTGPPAADVQAEPEASSFRLLTSNNTVSLPAGELVTASSYFWSPDKAHLVVRTQPQPCAGKPESTLYLVEASTGKLKNILRADSHFNVRWVDNDHFIYEDGAGFLRLYDAELRTQADHLKVKGGIGLHGVGAVRGAVCTEAPPEGAEGPAAGAAPAGSPGAEPGDDPMPPEETE